MNKFSLPFLSLALLFVSSCTWVKPTALSEEIQLVDDRAVLKCQKLGTTTSYVKHTLGPFARDEETVKEELVTLAKNRAAEMEGNVIVALGPIKEGNMSFDVYWCSN